VSTEALRFLRCPWQSRDNRASKRGHELAPFHSTGFHLTSPHRQHTGSGTISQGAALRAILDSLKAAPKEGLSGVELAKASGGVNLVWRARTN
jgi:hypothetical protein